MELKPVGNMRFTPARNRLAPPGGQPARADSNVGIVGFDLQREVDVSQESRIPSRARRGSQQELQFTQTGVRRDEQLSLDRARWRQHELERIELCTALDREALDARVEPGADDGVQ
jgi:hypothetical protein